MPGKVTEQLAINVLSAASPLPPSSPPPRRRHAASATAAAAAAVRELGVAPLLGTLGRLDCCADEPIACDTTRPHATMRVRVRTPSPSRR